jgi:hypothetical protein
MATKIIFRRLKYPNFRNRRPKILVWRLFFLIDLGDENQFSSPNVIFVYNLATKNCFLSPKVICVYNLAMKNLFLSPKDFIVICVYNLIIYKENTYNYSQRTLELLTWKYSVCVIC